MRAAALGAAALLLAGCAASDPPAAPAPASTPSSTPTAAPVAALPEVPGIAGEAVRLRTDEALGGQVQVRLTATGDQPFTVVSVALDSPGFTALPATPRDTTYRPGQVIDLPTPVGAVRCDAPVDPVSAQVGVRRPDGTVEQLAVPLAGTTMALVHAEGCAVERLARQVGVAVVDLADDGDRLRGEVLLTRRDTDDDVVVTALGRSVLVEPEVGVDLPRTLPAGADELALPVAFGPATCDPHVLAETKKPFVFPLSVVVGDAGPVPVDLPLDDAQRGRLQALVDRVCG